MAAAQQQLHGLYGGVASKIVRVGRTRTDGFASFIPDPSREAMVRRLLHAVLISAPFTVVVAGHSAVHASGNHFNQSKAHWFHSLLAPSLAAVGVQLVTRNHAMGGRIGSEHRATCFATSYGADADVVAWDYGMTAGTAGDTDYFFKQVLLTMALLTITLLTMALLDYFFKQVGVKWGVKWMWRQDGVVCVGTRQPCGPPVP